MAEPNCERTSTSAPLNSETTEDHAEHVRAWRIHEISDAIRRAKLQSLGSMANQQQCASSVRDQQSEYAERVRTWQQKWQDGQHAELPPEAWDEYEPIRLALIGASDMPGETAPRPTANHREELVLACQQVGIVVTWAKVKGNHVWLVEQIRDLANRVANDCGVYCAVPCPDVEQPVSGSAALNYANGVGAWAKALGRSDLAPAPAPAPTPAPEPATPAPAPALSESDSVMLSPKDLAKNLNLTNKLGAIKKKLDRWRILHKAGSGYDWIEVPDRRPNGPQHLYRVGAVRSLLTGS